MDFTGTVRIRPAYLFTWFIEHCSGIVDPRCTVALQQRLVCLADVISWLNVLSSWEYKELHESKWWDLPWYSQGVTAKSADVETEYYQPAPAEHLDLVISNLLQLAQLWNYISGVRGICVMNFSWLTIGKDLSHTHRRCPRTIAGKHRWVKTSGSLLLETLILIKKKKNGGLPISPRVNKGRHQIPLFSMALCSRSIFSSVDDLFLYSWYLIKYVHQNEESQGNFL